MGHILVVDDEPGLRGMLDIILRREGHTVALAADGKEALETLAADPTLELVISDLPMDPIAALMLLGRIRQSHPAPFVIIMTAFTEWDPAVKAMRQGAYNFLRKPFDNQVVKSLVHYALDARAHHLAARAEGESQAAVHLVGASP